VTGLAETIEERSRRWMQAWVEQDHAVLEDSLASDFALIVSAGPGQLFVRERWLATCGTYRATSFHYQSVLVREFAPGLAVMSAVAEQVATMGDVDRSGAFFVTDVWRLESDGQWRICSRYSSLPEAGGMSARTLGALGT
jgi:hypothetical protein